MEDDALPPSDAVPGHPHPRETQKLFGQDAAVRDFTEAWSGGRLHHAWILRGPQGIGKATLAYRIARALIAQPTADGGLFGEDVQPGYSLETPPDCQVQARIEAQSETRLYVLRREWDIDKKPPRLQTQIAVDNVRAMRRFLTMSAADGGWRVVIVDPADEMNVASANALLKFLEEPPAQTLFLLVAHAPAGLLPTIRSRCRTLDLAPLGQESLAWAMAGAGAETEAANASALAELAGGSAGQALRLSAGDGPAIYSRLVGLLSAGRGVERASMMQLADLCAGRDASDRYALVLQLTRTLLARLAKSAATGRPGIAAAPGEAELMAQAASHPAQAAEWAEALSRINATTRHAVAVNLDPAQCVIDTYLEIDATLGRVRTVAA